MTRLIHAAVAAAALSTALICGAPRAARLPTVALVHGAWEESNVWDNVAPKLRADGYKVVVITMPGRPSDPLGLDKVSLDLYRDTILKSIDKEQRPIALVGHSFAGVTISAVAEALRQRSRHSFI